MIFCMFVTMAGFKFIFFFCFLKLCDIQGPADEDGEEDALRGGLRPGVLLVLQVGGVFQYL